MLDSSKPYKPKQEQEIVDENAKYYPLPISERVQAAEFAARLRAAEKAHEAEQNSKKNGFQATTSATDLLQKRMERAYANRSEDKVDKVVKVANKHKLKKAADDEAAKFKEEVQEE